MDKTDNPYDPNKQEALYLAFEHGLNSDVEEDNPYTDMVEMREANSAWLRGFKMNKKRAKAIKPSPLTQEEMLPVETTEKEVLSVSALSDELLMAELKRRKQADYEKMVEYRSELKAKLYQLEQQINNLEILFGL